MTRLETSLRREVETHDLHHEVEKGQFWREGYIKGQIDLRKEIEYLRKELDVKDIEIQILKLGRTQ